jgi:hypothetical protein
MTNEAVALLRKRWASLMGWVAAMDYSAFDFTNDRIGGLERELEQLKDELRRTACLPEPPTAASNQVRRPAEPK